MSRGLGDVYKRQIRQRISLGDARQCVSTGVSVDLLVHGEFAGMEGASAGGYFNNVCARGVDSADSYWGGLRGGAGDGFAIDGEHLEEHSVEFGICPVAVDVSGLACVDWVWCEGYIVCLQIVNGGWFCFCCNSLYHPGMFVTTVSTPLRIVEAANQRAIIVARVDT